MSSELIQETETFIYYKEGLIDTPSILQKILDIKKREPDRTNISSPWEDRLIPKGVGEVKIWELSDANLCDYLCKRLAEVFDKVRSSDYILDFQVTEWQDGSFIPWHSDDPYLCAFTCYLENKTVFGGDFLCKPFEDQTLGMLVEPIVNRVLMVKGVPHCVTKIHGGTRTTLQVWGKERNANV